MSLKVKSILDEIKREHEEFTIDNKIVKFDEDVYLNEYQIKSIIFTIKKFISNCNIDFAKKIFIDIFKEPKNSNGTVYEVLVYSWLIEHGIRFEPQPKIKKEDCLKENDYNADGKIDTTIFDVKSFGIGFVHIKTLKEKIQEKLPNYIITIGGSYNISYNDLNKYAFNKIDKIVYELQQSENKINSTYIYSIPNLDLEIKAEPKTEIMSTTISQFNAYEWAKNNEFYFMKNASQFCTNSPYIIFCPFDNNINHIFSNISVDNLDIILRPLCRRIFMNLKSIDNRKVSEYDGKAKKEITVATASKKISAIIFLDVTKEHNYEDCRTWVYVNPNADNPLYNFQIDQWFRQNGAFIDDFEYDNY
ncbi:hypothetical protein [Clostridium perfringens]|uniref:hypothetical protein n=1 Tax=Clostridium perfringens TaxID=1502 RepID=UPI002446D25D|nr:hypothetical protein [Clostridium perfringens]MDH2473512.1 hypothetical protein [Clostridium perfringens]